MPRQREFEFVRIAHGQRAGFEFLVEPEQTTCQRGGNRDIRVCVGAADAVLDPPRGAPRIRHPQTAGAVVAAPMQVDRGVALEAHAAERVDVGAEQRGGRLHIALQAGDVVHQCRRVAAVGQREDVLAGLHIEHRLVDMHRRTGFGGMRHRHESRVHAVIQRGLAHQALEQEHLVGERQRIAVLEVDLELRGTGFVRHGADADRAGLAVIVDLVDHRIVFVGGLDAIGLASRFTTPGHAHRHRQGDVGIDILLDQVKFLFRRDDGFESALGIGRQHPLEHRARCERHHLALLVARVADDLRGWKGGPRHDPRSAHVGYHVDVEIDLGRDLGVVLALAGDRLYEHRFRYAQTVGIEALDEIRAGHDLAAHHPVHVRQQALDLVDARFAQPLYQRLGIVDVGRLVVVEVEAHGLLEARGQMPAILADPGWRRRLRNATQSDGAAPFPKSAHFTPGVSFCSPGPVAAQKRGDIQLFHFLPGPGRFAQELQA